MRFFVAFLAMVIAQFMTTTDAEVSCEECTTRIRDQLEKLKLLLDLGYFKTNTFETFFQVSSPITLSSDVCPGSNTSYEFVLTLNLANFLTDGKGSLSKFRNVFQDFYSTLANISAQPCQNGAILRNDNKSVYTIPDLCIKEPCLAKLPPSKIKGVSSCLSDDIEEIPFENEFRDFSVKFWVNVSGGKTRITEIEYMRDTKSSIRTRCYITDVQNFVVDTCQCIANDVFQKPFFETIIPRLLACYANGDAFAPVRNAVNCVT